MPVSYRSFVEDHMEKLIDYLRSEGVEPTDRDIQMLLEIAPIADAADRMVAGCWRICDKTPPAPPGHFPPPNPKVSGKFLFEREGPPGPKWDRYLNPEYSPVYPRFERELAKCSRSTRNGMDIELPLSGAAISTGRTYTSVAPTLGWVVYGDRLAVQLFVDYQPRRGHRLLYGMSADHLVGSSGQSLTKQM
jgi:hypothetical protein